MDYVTAFKCYLSMKYEDNYALYAAETLLGEVETSTDLTYNERLELMKSISDLEEAEGESRHKLMVAIEEILNKKSKFLSESARYYVYRLSGGSYEDFY